jgi:hypothetical protein
LTTQSIQNIENSPSQLFLNSPIVEELEISDEPSIFDLDEYMIKAEIQSNIKNINFRKRREKCLEITVADDSNTNESNTNEKENFVKEQKLIISKSNNILLQGENKNLKASLYISPTNTKLSVKGNILKKNFKIKLVKDDGTSNNLTKNTRRKKKKIINKYIMIMIIITLR